VGMQAAQTIEPRLPKTRPVLCGKDDLRSIPDDNVLDVPFAIDEDSNLAPNLVRKFRQLPSELRGDNLVCRDAPLVHLLQSTNLVGFEPQRFSFNLRDEIAPFDRPIDNESTTTHWMLRPRRISHSPGWATGPTGQ
jgi:hypothetical protein